MWPFHVCFSWIFKCLISVREWISKKQICNSNAGNYTSTNLKLYIQILYLKFEIHIDLINEMSCSQLMCLHTPTISPGEESDKVFSTIFICNFSPSFSILLGSWCDLVQPLGCSNFYQLWKSPPMLIPCRGGEQIKLARLASGKNNWGQWRCLT